MYSRGRHVGDAMSAISRGNTRRRLTSTHPHTSLQEALPWDVERQDALRTQELRHGQGLRNNGGKWPRYGPCADRVGPTYRGFARYHRRRMSHWSVPASQLRMSYESTTFMPGRERVSRCPSRHDEPPTSAHAVRCGSLAMPHRSRVPQRIKSTRKVLL